MEEGPVSQTKSYAVDVEKIQRFQPSTQNWRKSGSKSSANIRIKSHASEIEELIPYQPNPNCTTQKRCLGLQYQYQSSSSKKRKEHQPVHRPNHHLASFSNLPIWKRHFAYATQAQYCAMREMQSTIPSFLQLSSVSNLTTSKSKKQKSAKEIIIGICEFYLFCHERQQIWYKRKMAKLPKSQWTQDELLSSKHFTNLYRELDTGTIYFRNHVNKLQRELLKIGIQKTFEKSLSSLSPQKRDIQNQLPLVFSFDEEVLWAAICYRLLNRIETFEKVGGIPKIQHWKTFQRKLLTLRQNGSKSGNAILFTGAHQNIGFMRYIQTLESLQCNNCKLLRDIMAQIKDAAARHDLQQCTKTLQSLSNVGNFFAWQITCDIMECNILGDIKLDWIQLGPGAGEGLTYIFGEARKSNDVHLCEELVLLQSYIFHCLGVKFTRFNSQDLSLKDIEHSLCEFQKYVNCVRREETSNTMREYKPKIDLRNT